MISRPLEKSFISNFSLDLCVFLANVSLLILLARITFRLPFTPVPITGQTFGVLLISLLSGRNRSVIVMLTYLAAGFTGFPVLAGGHSWFTGAIMTFGPTTGYLLGMLISSWVVGALSDRGWSRHFWGCVAAGYIGSLCIFSCGLVGLSFFVPFGELLRQGYFPFVIGDAVKIFTAAVCVTGFRKCLR